MDILDFVVNRLDYFVESYYVGLHPSIMAQPAALILERFLITDEDKKVVTLKGKRKNRKRRSEDSSVYNAILLIVNYITISYRSAVARPNQR